MVAYGTAREQAVTLLYRVATTSCRCRNYRESKFVKAMLI